RLVRVTVLEPLEPPVPTPIAAPATNRTIAMTTNRTFPRIHVTPRLLPAHLRYWPASHERSLLLGEQCVERGRDVAHHLPGRPLGLLAPVSPGSPAVRPIGGLVSGDPSGIRQNHDPHHR